MTAVPVLHDRGGTDRSPRRRRVVGVLGLVVAAVLVAGGVLYWRWHDAATALFTYGGISTTGPLTVGGTLYLNSEIQPRSGRGGHSQIDVHRVVPRLTTNTAGATVQVSTCRVAKPDLGMGFGTDTKPCAAVAAFRPGRLDLGFPATELIYVVTATHSGTIRIEGADVGYSFDGRNGDQHAGTGILIRVRAHG